MPADPSPLILTLALHPHDQARFDRLRTAHFPAERNFIPAHVTLFHDLPGVEAEAVSAMVAAACRQQSPFEVHVTGLRSLGRGVAYTLESHPLQALRAVLARPWHDALSAQDRQGFRPHVTIQNKVTPAEAARLLATMQAAFTPFAVRAEGLQLWRYRGGPWDPAGAHVFSPAPAPPR